MFTYHTEKNRYGDERIAAFANGAEIAEIKPSSYYGNTEYIVSATTGGDDRGDYLGRVSTIAGEKKKIRDWYSENGATAPNSAAALRRLYNASVSKQGCIRSHFAGAFLDEQGRQYITDGFTLLRLNTPSTAPQWAPPPNDPHVYDTIPELLNSDGATVTLNLPTAAEVRAKIASDRAKYKAESHPEGDTLSTCFSWGDGLPMVNALYLLDILEALPGCTAACRPGELSLVYFHSPDGDALIMPIRRHIANSTDEQEEHNV